MMKMNTALVGLFCLAFQPSQYAMAAQDASVFHAPAARTMACIRYAMNSNQNNSQGVYNEAKGEYLVFRCYGDIARDLLDTLVDRPAYEHIDPAGVYEQKNFDGGNQFLFRRHRCWKRLRDAEGRMVREAEYGCSIYLRVGEFLTQ